MEEISRRFFLKKTGSAGIFLALATPLVKGLEAFASPTSNKHSYLKVYDADIDHSLNYFRERLGTAPEKNLIKAMIAVETGSPQHRTEAFRYDPMQIANEGDCALDKLRDGSDRHITLLGDFSFLDGKTHTPRANGRWNYSKSNMDAPSSIAGGIAWLFYNSAVYENATVEQGEVQEYTIAKGDTFSKIAQAKGTTIANLREHNPSLNPKKLQAGQKIKYRQARREIQITGWDTWNKGVKNYNGGGNPHYLAEVTKVKRELDKIAA